MVKSKNINKGQKLEETLRNYFLKAGYYVVRGVPFSFEGFNVTDIDLWLYGRASSVSREITIVDIKNKRTPQAIERIFWVQGLKKAVKATGAVVATTDRREAVKNFGKEIGVMVLDGAFLAKLSKSYSETPRLTEEEFISKIDEYSLGKLDGDWKGRIASCKSLLSKKISFDSCNEWLHHAKFFAEQSITKPKQRESALRCLYVICSYIAIAIDFSLRELSFFDYDERIQLIKDGFTYGSRGSVGMKKVLDVAMGLVEQHTESGNLISKQVRNSIESQLSSLNTKILGEFFAKTEVSKKLFTIAKEFEEFAMQRNFLSHINSSVDMRGMLYTRHLPPDATIFRLLPLIPLKSTCE
jgi:hypothetical protein